jgi:ABC-type Fe3+-hydroxamate transport system substrate-binding protein
MTNDEYRALLEAGPAVVMVAREDMLKLLEKLIEMGRLLDELKAAEKMVAYLQATPQ